MEYETTLRADGSGEENFTLDMSSISQLAGMFGGAEEDDTFNADSLANNLEEAINDEELLKVLEGETAEEDFDISRLLSNPTSMGNQDTSFVLYDAMSDSLRGLPNAELMKNIRFTIFSDSVADESRIAFNLKFKTQEERTVIRRELPNFLTSDEEEENVNKSPQGTPDLSKNLFGEQEMIDFKKGLIIIPAMEIDDDDETAEDEEVDMSDEDTKAMMNMFFGDSGLKNIYHLPGPVEFTSDPNAVIEGNTVTFYTSLIELMDAKEIPKRVIKYKVK